MERLTERGKDGKYFVRISRDSDLILGAEERLLPGLEKWTGWWEHTVLGNIVDRLAAYEDTGLAPVEVQQMRWIPVEERLPDKPGHYLVCTNVNYWHGGCMDKNGSSSNAGTTDGYAGTTLSVLDCFYDITGDWNRVCNAHVTHWMPLPQPPKEEAYEK